MSFGIRETTWHRMNCGSWSACRKTIARGALPNCGGALKIIAAIEDPPPVIFKILSHLGLPAPRRVPRRSESIYSKQSESRKPLANASRRRRSEFERAARSGTLRAPPTTTPPKPAEATLGFSSTERRLTALRAGDIAPIRKKGCLNFLYLKDAPNFPLHKGESSEHRKGWKQWLSRANHAT
jgi:hypothetical protein